MIRRCFRFGLLVGLLIGVGLALVRVFGGRPDTAASVRAPTEPWPRLAADPTAPAPATVRAVPDPAAPDPPAAKKRAPSKKPAANKPAAATTWVEPTAGVCPTSHPVKAKLASKIFHLPGMANYGRTKPDRCYATATQAEADGLRLAKR